MAKTPFDGLLSENEWIAVSERMPDANVIVLAYWPNAWIGLAEYWADEGWAWVEQDEAQLADADPTHWVPLPNPPPERDSPR